MHGVREYLQREVRPEVGEPGPRTLLAPLFGTLVPPKREPVPALLCDQEVP